MDEGVDGRWMTYAELAELRRIDKTSALKLAIRHKWTRQKNNRGQMQVCVPLEWAQPPERFRDTAVDQDMDRGVDLSTVLAAYEDAKAAFSEALKVAEKRADAAETRADQAQQRAERAETRAEEAEKALIAERNRADQVETSLDRLESELEAAKIARAEAEAEATELRRADVERRSRPLLARLRAALGGE